MTADRASVDPGGAASAEGNVRLEKSGQAVEAPTLTYDRRSTRLAAESGLRYHTQGLNLSAERAEVFLDQERGIFENTEFAVTANGGRGHARRVEALGPSRFELTGTSYSTCPGDDDDKAWLLSARQIELDQDAGRGEAWHAILRLFDMPVFYTPYLNFPIDDERHTGFLTPTAGHSDSSGFTLAAPYYLNLAPNYDATLAPRLLSDRGLELGGELRHLWAHHRGELGGAYLPDDDIAGDDRYLVRASHQGRMGERFSLDADFTDVSDREYFEDLDDSLITSSRSQLEQSLGVIFRASGARISALVQDFETLADDNPAFRTEPYARLPQIDAELRTPTVPWQLGLDAQVTRFSRDDSVDGLRTHARPRLAWRMDRVGWFANAEASVRYTRYDLEDRPAGTPARIERTVPTYTGEAGLRFERRLDNGWLQTLEPRAFYLFNRFEPQDDIPLFDAGVPDLNYDRLFTDNRFTGLDRIGDANQITVGVSSRLIEPTSGREVMRFDLGRIVGFRDRRVTLTGSAATGIDDGDSDIVAGAQYRPDEQWSTTAQAQYDPDNDRFNRAAAAVRYEAGNGARVSVGYRFDRAFRPSPDGTGQEDLEQTDIAFAWPVAERWDVIGRWNHSLDKRENVESLAGVEYRASCCWGLRAAWRRWVNDEDGNADTAFLLQVELNGLGRFGDDIRNLLDRDIVGGYATTDRTDTP